MNLYLKLREKQKKEHHSFPIGFAFNEKQFAEEMVKLGLKTTDLDKVVSIGFGGFIKKSDSDEYVAMLKRHKKQIEKAIEEDKNGLGFVKDMFDYELSNHEYGYTYDLDPTLYALDLTREDIAKNKKLYNGLQSALRRYK